MLEVSRSYGYNGLSIEISLGSNEQPLCYINLKIAKFLTGHAFLGDGILDEAS